jgi:hypothetical protein
MDPQPQTTAEIILTALARLQRIEDTLDALPDTSWAPRLRRDVAQRRAECLERFLIYCKA